MSRRPRRSCSPKCEQLDHRYLLSSVTPTQMRHAYGVDTTTFTYNGKPVQGDGLGQTIAIVVAFHDPYATSDLHTFDAANGLADPTLTQVNLAGGATDDGWAGEEMMDIEWAHAMAPRAAIAVVEARSDSISDLMAAVDTARRLSGVSVVSMSWGGDEFGGQTAYDSYFTTPAGHNGVTFVTASGDDGAWNGAEWPASSKNVVAVGGTSLRINTTGSNLGETAWYGSGGGYSSFVGEPSYQTNVQLSGRRTTPDVSMDADPYTGVSVYSTAPSTGSGSWGVYGGTSLSTQLFGAVVAIANEGRALVQKTSLDGPTQTLPGLYAFTSDYRDVTFGSNGYRATFGYDLATGMGTPVVSSLVRDLTQLGSVTASRTGTTRASSGGVATRFAVTSSSSSTTAHPASTSADVPLVAMPPELANTPANRLTGVPTSAAAHHQDNMRLTAVDQALEEITQPYLWN